MEKNRLLLCDQALQVCTYCFFSASLYTCNGHVTFPKSFTLLATGELEIRRWTTAEVICLSFCSLVESRQGLTISRLIVKAADQTDTGDYACSSDAGSSNSTAIHVITGRVANAFFVPFFYELKNWKTKLKGSEKMLFALNLKPKANDILKVYFF